MLKLVTTRRHHSCDGASRRDFLKVGALGLAGLNLPVLLAARTAAARTGRPVKDTSVIWLWLAGGASHIETFDPKMTAPVEYRSVTGEIETAVRGITIGGGFPKIARVADKMAFVRSFSHTNTDHAGGTHYVMTGYDNRGIGNGAPPTRPSIGAVAARARGPNHPKTGMPTYVRLSSIRADRYDLEGPLFLGPAYAPLDARGDARKSMILSTNLERVADRRGLLSDMDRLRRSSDTSRLMEAMDEFEKQAFTLILGKAPRAFDLSHEDPRTVKQYDTEKYGENLGQKLLIARRLCEAGCGFVSVSMGGWDHHEQINPGMDRLSPILDHAVSTFVEDIHQRGLDEKIMLVITGEFGRTPRINGKAGRDHWAALSTLAMSGGGLKTGQIVGQSASKADVPASMPISPQDLMATIFHVLGIDPEIQFPDRSGRPLTMIEHGKPIRELI